MALRVTVNYLIKEELQYELNARGYPVGSVEEMRKRLAEVLQKERLGDVKSHPDYPYTSEEDSVAITAKLIEVSALIDRFVAKDAKKTESKLWHVFSRIQRMDEFCEDRARFCTEAMALKEKFQSKLGAAARPAELEVIETSLRQALDLSTTPGCPHASSSPLPSLQPGSLGNVQKSVPVYKWDLKFSGRPGTSIAAFLERVAELSIARGVTSDQILRSALDLFEGPALTWYRSIKSSVNTWNQLERMLREEFQPANYDEKLLEEIKLRTQGESEPIGIYIATMTALFARLTCIISEDAKVKIVRRNVLPYFQNHLALRSVGSVEELRVLCRQLEESRRSVEDFIPPRRRTKTLEADLAYVEIDQMNDINNVSSSNVVISSPLTGQCFNCGASDHRVRNCPSPKQLKCYGCQQPGVTKNNCPRCKKTNSSQQIKRSSLNSQRHH